MTDYLSYQGSKYVNEKFFICDWTEVENLLSSFSLSLLCVMFEAE